MKMIPAEAYLPLVTLVITWWFKSRDEEKKAASNGQTSAPVASAAAPVIPVKIADPGCANYQPKV